MKYKQDKKIDETLPKYNLSYSLLINKHSKDIVVLDIADTKYLIQPDSELSKFYLNLIEGYKQDDK